MAMTFSEAQHVIDTINKAWGPRFRIRSSPFLPEKNGYEIFIDYDKTVSGKRYILAKNYMGNGAADWADTSGYPPWWTEDIISLPEDDFSEKQIEDAVTFIQEGECQ